MKSYHKMTECLSTALGATQYSLLTKALDGLSTVWPQSSFTSPLAVSPWRVYTKPGELNTVLYTVSDFHVFADLKKTFLRAHPPAACPNKNLFILKEKDASVSPSR